jgi:hypothetical protein
MTRTGTSDKNLRNPSEWCLTWNTGRLYPQQCKLIEVGTPARSCGNDADARSPGSRFVTVTEKVTWVVERQIGEMIGPQGQIVLNLETRTRKNRDEDDVGLGRKQQSSGRFGWSVDTLRALRLRLHALQARLLQQYKRSLQQCRCEPCVLYFSEQHLSICHLLLPLTALSSRLLLRLGGIGDPSNGSISIDLDTRFPLPTQFPTGIRQHAFCLSLISLRLKTI